MELCKWVGEASPVRGAPKLAFVSRPPNPSRADIAVLAYITGKPHPTVSLTGAVVLARAACIKGTVLRRLANGTHQINVRHLLGHQMLSLVGRDTSNRRKTERKRQSWKGVWSGWSVGGA